MNGLRILITNNTLAYRAGSELYVRDLATALLARGHTPIAYSPILGEIAEELTKATISVVSDLHQVGAPPDLIHGQHHMETMTALLHFPGVPAVYFCHGWMPMEESPPRFPRILQYVAVDDTCRDRVVLKNGIPEDRVRVLLNFVDLDRFSPRGPLPARPKRALVFANTAREGPSLDAVRQACAGMGVTLDVVGQLMGTAVTQPERILGNYDLVFARARAALEAMAVGAAVILYDSGRLGPMVSMAEFNRLRPLNFGVRTLGDPVSPEAVAGRIAKYDRQDAAAVSSRIRAVAGREAAIDEIIAVYEDVRRAHAQRAPEPPGVESQAAADYLRWLSWPIKQRYQGMRELDEVRWALAERTRSDESHARDLKQCQEEKALLSEEKALLSEEKALLSKDKALLSEDKALLSGDLRRVQETLRTLQNSLTFRLRRRILDTPILRRLARWGSRAIFPKRE